MAPKLDLVSRPCDVFPPGSCCCTSEGLAVDSVLNHQRLEDVIPCGAWGRKCSQGRSRGRWLPSPSAISDGDCGRRRWRHWRLLFLLEPLEHPCLVCPNSLSPIDKRSEEALSVQSRALDFRRRPTDRRGPIQLLRCARPHARALVLSLGFSPPLQRCRSLRRGTRATALKVVYKFRCEMERRARPSRRGV